MIRTYAPSDYEAVVAFVREFGDRHILGIPEKCSKHRVGFIWEDKQGRILGYSAMSFNSKYSITVIHKDYRKLGVGSKLMDAKIQWAKEHGLPYLQTNVGATNHASIGMLNKLGYVVVRLGRSSTGKPVLTMRLSLSESL